MKITYAQNPLRTTIDLDEHEKRELWHKIKYEEIEENILYRAYFYLTQEDYFNLEEAKKILDPDYYLTDNNQKSNLDQRVDELFDYYIQSLSDTHGGDCICDPCSCEKCHAESLLGVDTISGLGKHEASNISSAFWRGKDQPERTLDEVIANMEKPYNPVKGPEWKDFTDEQFQFHVPRWKSEHENALVWLKNYRNKHFTGSG